MSTYHIQAIRFDKKYFTKIQALNWAKSHGFKPMKAIDENWPNEYRLRLKNPKRFRTFRSKDITGGVRLILGYV